jgi:hypothetical protein
MLQQTQKKCLALVALAMAISAGTTYAAPPAKENVYHSWSYIAVMADAPNKVWNANAFLRPSADVIPARTVKAAYIGNSAAAGGGDLFYTIPETRAAESERTLVSWDSDFRTVDSAKTVPEEAIGVRVGYYTAKKDAFEGTWD